MSDNSANNKHIAKNTLLLYFLTLRTTFMALYTSLSVLNILSVEDYGFY